MGEHPGTGRKQESMAPVQGLKYWGRNRSEEGRNQKPRQMTTKRVLTEDGEGGYHEEPPSRGHRVPRQQRAAANGWRREEEGRGAAPLSARARELGEWRK
jgi:hypothetical protein